MLGLTANTDREVGTLGRRAVCLHDDEAPARCPLRLLVAMELRWLDDVVAA
jgi:hypothetical protein